MGSTDPISCHEFGSSTDDPLTVSRVHPNQDSLFKSKILPEASGSNVAASTGMKKWNLLLLSLAATQRTHADVDMKNGSYIHNWTDPIAPRDRREVKVYRGRRVIDSLRDVHRTYNSRRLTSGLFGLGWTSSLDNILGQQPRTPPELTYQLSPSGRLLAYGPYQYHYDEHDTLIAVSKNNRKILTYSYDTAFNLTQVSSIQPGFMNQEKVQVIELVKYNAEDDRPIEVQDALGCIERFKYTSAPVAKTKPFASPTGQLTSTTDLFTSQVERNCPQQPPTRSTYTFQYSKNSLVSAEVQTGSTKTVYQFDIQTGQPVSVRTHQPGRLKTFEQGLNGGSYESSNRFSSGR
jgi:hypothetical protein